MPCVLIYGVFWVCGFLFTECSMFWVLCFLWYFSDWTLYRIEKPLNCFKLESQYPIGYLPSIKLGVTYKKKKVN